MAGVFPIAQVQEPYTSIGYMAARLDLPKILHLKHPIDIERDEDIHGESVHIYIPTKNYKCEHQWSAWDICVCMFSIVVFLIFKLGLTKEDLLQPNLDVQMSTELPIIF